MKNFLYLVAGIIFSWGLLLSGMSDPEKVKNFLSLGATDWSPALLFVLGPAALTYLAAFLFLRKRQKTLNGVNFQHPKPRPVDRALVLGSILFGVGWGLAGVCPGPALVHLAFPDLGFLVFIATMLVGFEIQRKLA